MWNNEEIQSERKNSHYNVWVSSKLEGYFY